MICIPIKKKTEIDEAQEKGDIVELWFDEMNLDEKSLEDLFKKKKKPWLYKITNAKLFEEVLQYKPEYIDLDIGAKPETIKKLRKISPRTQLIVSYHNFKNTPANIDETVKRIAKRADIIKIATHAKTFTDTLRILGIIDKYTKKGKRIIGIAMGKEGVLTRTAGHLIGNYLMYAPLKKSQKTAEGQMTVEELRKIINDK